jgi:chromosome segregation protein
LLGDTLILESLDAALALARRYPDHPRLVTLEGELLETSGALTGGRLHKGGQMLALRRRAAEAATEADRLQTEGEGLAGQANAAREALAALDLAALRERQANLLAELRAVTGSLSRRSQVGLPEAPLAVEVPQTDHLASLRAERDRQGYALAQAREAVLAWRRYREDLARFDDSQQSLGTARAQTVQFIQEERAQQLQLGQSAERQRELGLAREALDMATLEAALQQARALVRALAEQETAALARTNTVLGELETAKLTQARREATIEAVLTELQEVPDGPIEEGTSRGLAAALNRVEAELNALGPVNHLAEREYAAIQEELSALEATLTETQEAVLKLQAELDTIETEYRERLEGIYEHFKDRFSEYARSLLDAEALLERTPTGLNLVLRPEGKRTVNLNLLSMGERTMGALAFLFALSEVGENGGLPIAVLDEVDAPLDEANIQRLCRFLRHFSSQTQFILVTHQKRTMEACDALYGVTSDKGISRVYSIQREEAVA